MIDSCARCPHLGASPFCDLDEKHLDIVRGLLRPYSVEGRGKAIFNQGQPVAGVYFLCAGFVKLPKLLEGGDEIILDVLSPCAVIGELPHLDAGEEQRHEYSAVSLSDVVEIRFLSVPDFKSMPGLLPQTLGRFVEHCCERLSRAYKDLETMQLPVEERLLSKLLHLARAAKEKTPVPLSFVEMAQFVQTTPETISRTVRRLVAKGQVQIVKGRLFLKNLPPEPLQSK